MGIVRLFIAALAFISITSFADDKVQCRAENEKVYHCNYTHHLDISPAFNCTFTGVNDYQYQHLDDHVILTSYTPNVAINGNQSLILTTASRVNASFFLPNLSGGAMIIGIDIVLSGESPANISVSCVPGEGGKEPFQ